VRRSVELTAKMSGQRAYELHEQGGRFDGECRSIRKNIRRAHGAPKAHLLLVMQRTRLKKSLPHISATLRVSYLPDGLFAQPIEMGFTFMEPTLYSLRALRL
jgi:hypothetical protein